MSGFSQFGVDLSATGTTAAHGLGAEAFQDGTIYQYVKAGSTIAVGDALILDTSATDEPFVVIPSAAVNQVVAGIAPVAIASASYGWIVIRGKVPSAKVAASTAAGAQLGTSATAGTLSTITIAGTYAQGEVQRVLAAAAGLSVQALEAESGGLSKVAIL